MGQRVKPVPGGPWFTVLGVAANVKNSGLGVEDEPEYYQLRRNVAEDWQQGHSAALVVKTACLRGDGAVDSRADRRH